MTTAQSEEFKAYMNDVTQSFRPARTLDNSRAAGEASIAGCTTQRTATMIFSAIKDRAPEVGVFLDAGHGTGRVVLWAAPFFDYVFGFEVAKDVYGLSVAGLNILMQKLEKKKRAPSWNLMSEVELYRRNIVDMQDFGPVEVLFMNLEGICRQNDWPRLKGVIARSQLLKMSVNYEPSEDWERIAQFTIKDCSDVILYERLNKPTWKRPRDFDKLIPFPLPRETFIGGDPCPFDQMRKYKVIQREVLGDATQRVTRKNLDGILRNTNRDSEPVYADFWRDDHVFSSVSKRNDDGVNDRLVTAARQVNLDAKLMHLQDYVGKIEPPGCANCLYLKNAENESVAYVVVDAVPKEPTPWMVEKQNETKQSYFPGYVKAFLLHHHFPKEEPGTMAVLEWLVQGTVHLKNSMYNNCVH